MSTTHQEALNKAAKELDQHQEAARKALGARECALNRTKANPAASNYRVLAESIDREVNALHRKVGALRELAAKARAIQYAKA